jgi:hypothetical protein
MHARGAADDDGVEGTMSEHRRKVRVRDTAVQLGQFCRTHVIRAVHRDYLDPRDLSTRARVGVADVSRPDQCDVRHGRIFSWLCNVIDRLVGGIQVTLQ